MTKDIFSWAVWYYFISSGAETAVEAVPNGPYICFYLSVCLKLLKAHKPGVHLQMNSERTHIGPF